MRSPSRKHPRHRAVEPPNNVDLDAIAEDVRYVGSPEHKRAPSFAGPPSPRPDASICDLKPTSGPAELKKFMADLTFDIEWIEPETTEIPEFGATWAALRILVDERCVTRFYDRQTNSVRKTLILPLYSLAEWIAGNWWSLCR